MNKEIRTHRNKNMYLIGIDRYGEKLWLESPSWDCGWYWGFGCLVTFQKSEMVSITHMDSAVMNDCSNIFESPYLKEKTFTEKEGWNLTELFRQFYLLRNMAEFAHMGNCNVTVDKLVKHTGLKPWEKKINEVMIPKITAKILKILTPKK